MEIINKLKHYKEANKLSTIALGDYIGTSPANITNWIAGVKKPNDKSLKKITDFLNSNEQVNFNEAEKECRAFEIYTKLDKDGKILEFLERQEL